VPLASKPSEAHLDDLRGRLARHGVPLFEPTPTAEAAPSGPSGLAALLGDLVTSGDPRLEGSVPCLLAAVEPARAARALADAARARPDLGARLGRLYRLARALVVSRGPDLERLFGPRSALSASALEPDDLPDPSEAFGERTLWRASERARARGEPDEARGIETLFDTWLLLVGDERSRVRA
jgi:hypothetical protein